MPPPLTLSRKTESVELSGIEPESKDLLFFESTCVVTEPQSQGAWVANLLPLTVYVHLHSENVVSTARGLSHLVSPSELDELLG